MCINNEQPRPPAEYADWTPDQMAECVAGITPDLYRRLWSFVTDEACPDMHRIWVHLSVAERAQLDALWQADHGPSYHGYGDDGIAEAL